MDEKVFIVTYKMKFPLLRPAEIERMAVSGVNTRAQAAQEAIERAGKIRIIDVEIIKRPS